MKAFVSKGPFIENSCRRGRNLRIFSSAELKGGGETSYFYG